MPVLLARHAGFCFGVKRATERVEGLLDDGTTRVYTLGELIHNPRYIATLEERGIRAITEAEASGLAPAASPAVPCTVVLRTHGVPRETEEELRALTCHYPCFHVEDMTCPFVKRIHRIAAENTEEGRTVFLLFGAPEHPEVQGILSYVRGERYVFSTEEELDALMAMGNLHERTVILAAQTTQNLKIWENCKKNLLNHFTNVKIFDTICSVTDDRQTEAMRLAAQSDAVIVIGGGNSSNTQKLFALCRELCPRTYRVESAAELPAGLDPATQTISITAGASTPHGIIMEVYKSIMAEELNFAEMLEESFKTIHTGDTVTGTVMSVDDKEIKLDLGAKTTGVIAREQITDDPAVKLSDLFKSGDEVTAFVIRVDDNAGVANLSKKRIDAERNWLRIVGAYNGGEIVTGRVTKAIKGGLLFSVEGIEIFVPASLTGLPKDADLSTLVGTEQRAKIISIEEGRKHAKASFRAVLAEERRAREEAFYASVEVGRHYNGVVKSLTSYGAFVDLGGVDGLLHNTELSWKRIKHPSQVVSVGQELDVYVKDFDPETKRISLGYKTQENDSWYQFTLRYKVGDVIPAKIVSMVPFGAFAEVYDGVDGLIHISKISLEKIERPEDVLSIGQEVTVKITEIDDENRRLSLSIRALLEEARREAEREERRAADEAAAAEEAAIAAEMAPYIARVIEN